MVVVAVVTVTFIIIGDINQLAPIVTMPFLITYACIDYSYFALAQTFDLQHRREMRYDFIFFFLLNCILQKSGAREYLLSILFYHTHVESIIITYFSLNLG